MDSNIIENEKTQALTENSSCLNTKSTNYSEIFTTPNKKFNKFTNLFTKIINNEDPLNMKSKYFYRWKNIKKKSNLRSLKILKIESKKIRFETPLESAKKNKEKKELLEGKININLFKRLLKKQDDKLKYFFEKWKNLKYMNKSRNYNFKKREIKKIKILPKKKNPDLLYPINNDDIYNNIINLLNKINKSKRQKALLSVLEEIEKLEKNNILKAYYSHDSISIEEEKKDNSLRNKISERTFKRLKNAIDKSDVKQKYFNKWKKLTIFRYKSNKSIKRINRIILTRKQKDSNASDYDAKSYKTMDYINNIKSQNKDGENAINNYILPLYKQSDKLRKLHIKNTILKILKLLEETKKEIPTPSTPFNDSSFSFSFMDNNTDRSEEESFYNASNKSISKRMLRRLKTIFDKKDIKMVYFKKWKENVQLNNKRHIIKKVLNKKDKQVFLKKLMESDIFSTKKNDIDKKVNNNEKENNKKEEPNTSKESEPNKEKNKIYSLNDYLNSNADFKELENVDEDEINDDNTKKFEKNMVSLEKIPNSEITPKKQRNSNHFRFNTDFNLDFLTSSETDKKGERYSATPGRYRMSFKKVFLTRSKTKNPSSTKKKSFRNILRHIIKASEKKNLKKYFDIWKNIDNKENSDIFSDKEDENVLEIIKTDDLKLENRDNNEILINEENVNVDKKIKNSCLNGIYGICDTEDFIFDKNMEEHISIYGNAKSKKISENIQPHFSDFLKAMNCSIATFNLFTYYSQLHDNKFLIKKKFLPIWRNVK